MNLLENYIVEVHDVREIKSEWREGTFIAVDLTVNCYGNVSRVKTSFSTMEEWNKVKEQGYYLA